MLLGLILLVAADASLQFYSSTSGAHVEHLFDGKRDTTWSAVGAGQREGVFMRFEQPTAVDKLRLVPCDGTPAPQLYLNGAVAGFAQKVGDDYERSVNEPALVTVFVRSADEAKKFCLAEISFVAKDKPLSLALAKRIPATITASSTLSPADAFAPAFIADQRLDFGWAEGGAGTGPGESLRFDFSTSVTVSGLELWNGYHRSKDHFAKNARVSSLELKNEKGETRTLAVKDAMERIVLAVTPPLAGKQISLTVKDIYKGAKYPDLVISELRFLGPDGPFIPASEHREERQQRQLSEAKGTALELLQDAPLKLVCRPGESAILKLRSNLSLVSYASKSKTDDEASSVTTTEKIVEGAWIPKNIGPEGFAFDLYARRYVAREKNEFYGGGSEKEESEGIVGGAHKVAIFSGAAAPGLEGVLKELKKAAGAKVADCAKARAKDGKLVVVLGPVWANAFLY